MNEAPAVNQRRTVCPDGLPVQSGPVSLVLFESILRVHLVIGRQDPVPDDLGHD